MSSLMSIATPPPRLFFLGLLTHLYPSTMGCVLPSFVSASPMMWAFVAWAADIRLVTFPVIPSGFVYRRFRYFCFLLFFLFFLLLAFLLFFFSFLVFCYLGRFFGLGCLDRTAQWILVQHSIFAAAVLAASSVLPLCSWGFRAASGSVLFWAG